mmetsp:Transcript_48602/g.155236  ORF Transcript_48602/g.155236 Transcript_48602/m.155236 type:complete len:311 (-) Transcript_48602:110-1042(-)
MFLEADVALPCGLARPGVAHAVDVLRLAEGSELLSQLAVVLQQWVHPDLAVRDRRLHLRAQGHLQFVNVEHEDARRSVGLLSVVVHFVPHWRLDGPEANLKNGAVQSFDCELRILQVGEGRDGLLATVCRQRQEWLRGELAKGLELRRDVLQEVSAGQLLQVLREAGDDDALAGGRRCAGLALHLEARRRVGRGRRPPGRLPPPRRGQWPCAPWCCGQGPWRHRPRHWRGHVPRARQGRQRSGRHDPGRAPEPGSPRHHCWPQRLRRDGHGCWGARLRTELRRGLELLGLRHGRHHAAAAPVTARGPGLL